MDLVIFIGIICAFIVLWHFLGWWADWSASSQSQVRDILKKVEDEIKRAR